MAHIRHGIALCVFIATSATLSSGQTPEPPATKTDGSSCRAFVQEFYDWYTPIAASQKDRLTGSLRPRRSSFDPELWKMLVADEKAQSKSNEIVGLDFDPILNSQDLSSKFVVKSASTKSDHCNAVVVGINQEIEDEHVAPELIFSDGRWVFVNFHYQNEVGGKLVYGNLVQALKDWQKERVSIGRVQSNRSFGRRPALNLRPPRLSGMEFGLAGEPRPKCLIHASLPATARGTKALRHIGRKPDRNGNLSGSFLRAAPAQLQKHFLLCSRQCGERLEVGNIRGREFSYLAVLFNGRPGRWLRFSQSFAVCHKALPPFCSSCES